MRINMYSIRDIHNGFMSPSLDTNHATAKRNFALMINNNPGVLGFRPADFDLYWLGTFDTDSGQAENLEVVEFVVNGASVVGE